jgi:hypothetical protein
MRRKSQFRAGDVMMKHIILALIVIAFFSPIYNRAGTAEASEPNLVAYWTFDEGSGTIAYDSAGTNNGNLIDGPIWTTGRIDGGLSFDGTNDYVNCGSGTSNYDNITVSVWMKTSTTGVLVSNRYNSSSYGTWYTFSSTGIELGGNSSGVGYMNVTFNTPTLDGLWNHVVYAKNGTSHAIYVNGSLDQSFTSSADISWNVPLYIGRKWTKSYNSCFNGIIDDVRIYNRGLSSEEILQLFLQSTGLTKAYDPNPANNSSGINPDAILSWKPGNKTVSHDVYFGTNYNDVNNAVTSSSEYMGNLDINTWMPCGLNGWTYYYWRIDEINEPNLWKGNVWSFQTACSTIELSTSQLEFYILKNEPNQIAKILGISNNGGWPLSWQLSENCSWLEAIPSSGTCTTEIDQSEITVNVSGLEVGRYDCFLTVSDSNASNSPQTVQVVLHVTEMPPSEFWRDYIVFPDDPFKSEVISENDPGWVKFTIILSPPYDPNIVYFQDSSIYPFHYQFATEWLEPFIGMNAQDYYNVTLYDANQQAVIGAVIMPADANIKDYGIQLIRYDAYTKEETAQLFNTVKASIVAEPDVNTFYFPSYEQLPAAEANSAWLESQGIIISSTARWAKGNACYSPGWALGTLKYYPGNQINQAYADGNLLPEDILLTDGVPAEVPFLAGILTLTPSTPSSHVAILAQTFGIPFGHLALAADANKAQQLVGHLVTVTVSNNNGFGYIKITDMNGLLTQDEINQLLAVKVPKPLDITAMEPYGAYSFNTNGLEPNDIRYFGGKAANFGILRRSIPDNCPNAIALSFDLWNEFLDQPITPSASVTIAPHGYILFWADNQPEQGLTHAGFKLSKSGEAIGLFDIDGETLIDGFSFGNQTPNVSYGRTPNGSQTWSFFSGGDITPGAANPGGSNQSGGLFINEFMADNTSTIQDEYSEYDDWFEIYNASDTAIDLGGMYLTDDLNNPTNWMIPVDITGNTLRQEIANRLSGFTYPVSNLTELYYQLAAIRNIITNPAITHFSPQLQTAILTALEDPNIGFDLNRNIRFRSSTNVEDANQFSGAGLYDSFSGCLADDLDGDESGPCLCDPNEQNERGVFRAIRKVFASFYNDNAFLERLHHSIDENDVGMAILVHHSSPDQFELANGVATLEKRQGDPNRYIKLVTQKGAVSVANPDDGSIPEEVTALYKSETDTELTLVRSSNLVILGETVLDWPADYNSFAQLLAAASEEFETETGKTDYLLDFEYKKLLPGGSLPNGGLAIKQIREIPKPDQSVTATTPFLVNSPVTYFTLQAGGQFAMEEGNIFSSHRLKSIWTLNTKSMWLTPENLAHCFYSDVTIEYAAEGKIRTIKSNLPLLPGASHSFAGTTASDSFVMAHLSNPRTYTLTTQNVITQVAPAESPIVTLSDFGEQVFIDGEPEPLSSGRALNVSVLYGYPPYPDQPTQDNIRIIPLLPYIGYQYRTWDDYWYWWYWDDWFYLYIDTAFYRDSDWLLGHFSFFDRTYISGLTTEPFLLWGYYSQTYCPGRHNGAEEFLFEPRLEPGISQSILDELESLNIQLMYWKYREYNITALSYYELPFLVSDIDGNHKVDFVDFSRLGAKWLYQACNQCDGADLNDDGRVDIDDLVELAQEWLCEI